LSIVLDGGRGGGLWLAHDQDDHNTLLLYFLLNPSLRAVIFLFFLQ
jgi:hypothetical protein